MVHKWQDTVIPKIIELTFLMTIVNCEAGLGRGGV